MCELAVGLVGIVSIIGLLLVFGLKDEFLDWLNRHGLAESAKKRLDVPLGLGALAVYVVVVGGLAWAVSENCP